MRILMCGDTHGDLEHLTYLLDVAREQNCDRIFVLGDFGLWEHTQDGIDFMDRLNELAMRKGVSVYCLDGNHDNWLPSIERALWVTDKEYFFWLRPNIRYAGRGFQWNWGGKDFIALGGAYSVDKDYRLAVEARRGEDGTLWFPTEEMTDQEMEDILAEVIPGVVNVVLAHDKPLFARPGWNRKNLPLCIPNQQRMQRAVNTLQPELYFHGHLHFRYHDAIGIPYQTHSTAVYGLDCNAGAAESYEYTEEKSWCVYDTETGVEWDGE